MAVPAVGEVWAATNPQHVADGDDMFLYKVESIKDIGGVDFARIHMIGNQAAGGFYKFVRSSYMDSSPYWTLQADPIP